MVDVSERLKGFDPAYVLSLLADFLGGSWSSATLDDFSYQPLNQGFGNRVILCQLTTNDLTSGTPRQVLVRFYGGNVLPKQNPIRSLTEMTEVLVYNFLGLKKLGPRLYGTFDGGRLEEYIPSVNLTVESFCRDAFVNDRLAAAIGRFHCVSRVPIKKTPWNVRLILSSAIDSYLKRKTEVLKSVPVRFYEMSRDFFEFDFVQEILWVTRLLPKVNSRVVFCHNDLNRSNILVRQDGGGGRSHPDDLVIIDYEFSGYNFRGIDLGNHFGMKVFDFGSSSFVTGYDYPDEDFRRRFLESYVAQVKVMNGDGAIFPDWDDSGRDSVDHLLLEAEFGQLIRRLTNITGILGGLTNWINICDKRQVIDPVFKDGLIFKLFVDFYRQRKEAFMAKWPGIADGLNVLEE